MTIFFQDKDTEEVLFRAEERTAIPNVREFVKIDSTWYIVSERNFYFNNKMSSCTIWVTEAQL